MQHPGKFWDEKFDKPGYNYGKEPNVFFKAQLDRLIPGKLLLPAEGEGRNGLYAAQNGWEVTAFDVSIVGRKKALALAEENGVKVDYLVGDLLDLPLEEDCFDALACIYAHFPPNVRAIYNQQLSKLLKPGGTIIFEAFSKEQLEYQKHQASGGPKSFEMLFSEEEVKKEFPGINFEYLSTEEVNLSEGAHHNGLGSVVRMVGKRL